MLAGPGVMTRADADAGESEDARVRLPDGRRHRRPRHRPDHRREAQRGRGGRGDGGHRRGHRPRRPTSPAPAWSSSRWPSRDRTCGSTCRSSASPTIQAMAPGGRDAAVARRRPDADVRQGDVIAAADDAGIAVVGRATRSGGMSAPLRLGVVGVGHLGRHHARLLGTLAGVRLVGVVDANAARAAEIAAAADTVGRHRLAGPRRAASTP